MANPAKLWQYVNTGKVKFSDLNEEGIKTFLDYGYKQGYIKESQLTDKAKILLGIKRPLAEQREILRDKVTPPSYLMGSPSSILPQKVTQPKVTPSTGIGKRETLEVPPHSLMGSPSKILPKTEKIPVTVKKPELKSVEPASYLMGRPSDILPKVEKVKTEEPKPKKEVPLTQMAGSPRELIKKLGYKLPETEEPSYSEVFTRSLAAGATETTGSLAKVGELIWEGSRRLWNLIVPESLETPEKNIIGEALKKTREFYEKSTQDYVKDMQGLKGLKKFINIGTMPIPQIAASAMMGFGITGIGAGGQLLRTGSRIPKEILRMIPFGTIATGGYAAEAEKEGANYTQQVLYGVLGGLGEMATESPVFEGWLSIIEKLGAGELVEAGARNIFQRYGKLGIEWLKNAAKESAQEAAMEPITMLAKRATYDPKAIMTMQQMAESAYGGFAMSTLLGALGLPAASLSRQMAEDAIRNGKQADTELIENIARQMKKDLENIAEVAEVVEAGFEPKRLSERISSRLGEAAAKDFVDAFEKGYVDRKDVIAKAIVSTYNELMESGYAEAKPEAIRQKAEEVLERKINTGEIIEDVKQAEESKAEVKPKEEIKEPETIGVPKTKEATKKDEGKVEEAQGEKQSWEMTWEEYYNDKVKKQATYTAKPSHKVYEEGKARHERIIKKALEKGYPVPEEVLKDYPNLLERVKTEQEKTTAKKESKAAGKTLYRYYLTLRPPSPGAQPKGFINAVSFDKKKYVDDIGKEAWGYVEYDKPIENPEGWDMVPDKKTIASIEQTNVEELNKIEQEQRKEEAVKPKDIPEINVDFDSLPNTGFKKGQFQIAYPNGNKKAVKGYLYKDFGIQEGTKDITYIPAGAKIPLPNARNLSDVKRATKFIADMTEHISKDVSKFKEYILREKPEIYSLAKKIAKGLPRFRDIDKAEYMRSVLTPEEAKIYADYIERTGILEVGEKARQERPVQARQILKKDDMLKIEGELADKYILTQYWFIERSKAPKPLTNLYDKQLTDAIKLLETKTINKLLDNMKDFSPAVVEDVKDKYVVLRDKSGNTVRAIDKKYYDYFTRYGFEFGLKEGQDLIAITKNGEIAGVVISKRVPESAVERFAPKGGYVIRAEQPKLTKEKLISKEEVIRVIEESFGIPVRHGRYIGKALGIYKVKPEIIRTKTANDIYVVAHELGHHLQSLLDMPKKPNTKIADELKALARNVKGAPLKEGFSEFIRLYLTNEGIAQQTAPNLYNEFNQKITAFPEIGDAFDAVREAYKQYSGLSDLEKVQAHIVFDKPKPEQDTSFIDKFYAGCVDDLHMINKKFTELVQGRKVPVGLHPYFRAKLIKGLEGVVGDVLYRGVRDINKRSEIIGPAFKDIVGQFKTREELNDFAVYLVIKHAQELHDLGKKTGLEDVNLSEALNELDAKYGGLDKFEQSARQLYDFIDAVLRGTLLSSGIISQETYNILRKTYPLYVPFYRLMDDKQGTLSKGRSYVDLPQPIKRLKGSGRRILNPIETLILNTYTFYSIAERNNIARLFIEWEETLPGRGKLVEKVSPTLKPFTFKVEEIEKTLLKNTDLPPDAFAEVQDLTITLFRALHHSIPKENISTVFIDGQHVMYQFDPEIYDALKGMTPNTFGALIKILRPFTIMLRTGATKNLDFPFTNVIKDQLEATVFSKYGYIPILDFLRGVASYIKHDKYLSDYFASGAAHASIVSLDRDYLSGAVRKLAKLPRTPGEIVMAPVEFLQAILEGSEIPTRLGEFKRGIQKEAKNVAEERKTALENRNKYYELHQKALVEGRHPQEIKQLYAEYSYWNKVYNYLETYTAEEILFRAGVAAKEVTIDFTRIGKNVKDINAVRAFFNPSIQGIDKIARSFRENPKKMLFRVAFYIILPSLLAYLLNRDNEWYKERLRWEKDYYMHFPITADGKRFLRIPRGHMLGITFGALTQRFLEYIDQKDPEALDEIGETVMNELLLDLVPQDKFTLFKIGPIPIGFPQGLIPDGIKTAMEIYANMSTFTDTPIIPASEEHLEPFMQYGPYTPEILKTLGRTFGFSPRKVEHAIRGYTGGLGKNVLDILDFLTRPVGKETAPPEGAVEVLEDIPGIRRFIAQPLTASQSATINRFYKDYSRAETVYRTAKAYAERTGKPYIPKTKEDRELLQQYKTLERIRNNLSSIRKSIANIQNLADMPPKEKKEAIEKLNTLMIDLVREYYGKKKLR